MDIERLSNDGERAVEANYIGYWAHLSIYRFAAPFVAARKVLDIGSGAGFGAAYLARQGTAAMLALDGSADAIEHSRQRYAGDAVTFEVADLNQPLPLGDHAFDVIFSSNVFEHIAKVDQLAGECARVIATDGVVIIAVPPVKDPAALEVNIRNHWHVQNIPPAAWEAKLLRFFGDVRCHAHRSTGEFASWDRIRVEQETPPDRVTIRETDFEFPESDAATLSDTWTAVFVCRAPRGEFGPETLAERAPSAWCEGDIAAKVIREERAAIADLRRQIDPLRAAMDAAAADAADLRRQVDALQAEADQCRVEAAEARCQIENAQASETRERDRLRRRIAELERSTSWRITGPARAVSASARRLLRPRQ